MRRVRLAGLISPGSFGSPWPVSRRETGPRASAREGVGVRLPTSAFGTRNRGAASVLRPRVMSGGNGWRRAGVMAAALLGVLLLGPARPASASVRVFVGGAVGFPVYPYPYPYYYPYPAPYAEVPPPGWAPGQWEWRYDPWGRPYRVWVPPHLR